MLALAQFIKDLLAILNVKVKRWKNIAALL
jgi:hypothetical protein